MESAAPGGVHGEKVQTSLRLTHCTADAHDSVSQSVDAFAACFSAAAARDEPFSGFDELAFALSVAHPLAGIGRQRASGSFHAASRTFYSSASLQYDAWIGEDWAGRIEAVAQAVRLATKAIHKTRITEAERATLNDLVERCTVEVRGSPPSSLVALKPVVLTNRPGQSQPQISFEGVRPDTLASEATVLLQPSDIATYMASLPQPDAPPPETFKRYRRLPDGIDYFEAWPTEQSVVEHWGACGERGQTRQYPTHTLADQLRVLDELKAKAADLGFKPISPGRHATMVLTRPLAGRGSGDDLAERHSLEQFMDDKLGWLGLGHCDGGSIGSGTMEVFCVVVNYRLAADVIGRELANSRFGGFEITRLKS